MATTKKCVKFYAEPDIEKHLDTIPAQARSIWINQVLAEAIARQAQPQAKGELIQLRDWLGAQPKPQPLQTALAELLTEFINRDV